MECDCCGRKSAGDEPYAGWLREYFAAYYETICSQCGQMLEAEAHDLLEEFAKRMYLGQKTADLLRDCTCAACGQSFASTERLGACCPRCGTWKEVRRGGS
ncbi:MAG: hypothetical protein HYY96_01775 [Candidatus Tectomicrobia bacterium]|nr:hypothetical protein [Candidatus Tectomicrobia bacterium]